MIRALLASDALPALDVVLAGRPARRAVLVPTAAAALSDRDAIVAPVRAALAAAGAEVVEVEAGTPGALAEALREADLVAVSGGDPFALLAALRAGGADEVRAAAAAGLPYVGISAGAMVAGPTLAPVVHASPFRPQPGQDLAALGLVDVLVLPHDDRPGRAAKNRAAARAFPAVRTVALRDGEAVLVRGGRVDRLAVRPAP